MSDLLSEEFLTALISGGLVAAMPLLFQWQCRLEHRPVGETSLRGYLDDALAAIGVKDASGQLLRYTFHDFRRLFITEAIMHGMPPHIAQLVAGHRDINTTMGYKAVYPEEVINGHRAFIARRRALRPAAEYRTPSDEEWAEFLGHFERRKVALGDCGRAWGTSCVHEHSCERCPLLRPDPAQRPRLAQIGDSLPEQVIKAALLLYLALPELLRRGATAEFVYIDGWHSFDYALVDFFYADKLLADGGIVGFNDASFRSVHKVLRFVTRYRRYREIDVGLKPDYRGRIFDAFFSTKEGGIGLGLALAFEIIKMHHGHLSFTSKVGKGSAFIVSLPLKQ